MRSAVAIIINPVSGGARPEDARRRAEHASAVLTAAGVAGDIFVTERRGHARDLAAAAVARGVGLVVAWGGDGAVNEVASALAFTPTPLAIVPSGSGNGLARELGVDRHPARSITQALDAAPRRIDAGEFGICRSCGERISEKRLRANPTTELCINCKVEQEKKGLHETDS